MDQKILCVYYSRTGYTEQVINEISNLIKCDVERIGEPRSRKGLLGFIRSGYEATTKEIITIDEVTYDPSQYDLVILATPLWAGTVSSPVRSYLRKYQGHFKNEVAFIVTSGSQSSPKVLSQLEELTGLKPKSVLELKQKDFKHNRVNQELNHFVKDLNH